MTPERLQQLAERYDDEMIRREHVAELLVAVDHLTAEIARLRECATEAVDYCNDMARDYEAGYVARAVLDLLNPTDGETDHA